MNTTQLLSFLKFFMIHKYDCYFIVIHHRNVLGTEIDLQKDKCRYLAKMSITLLNLAHILAVLLNCFIYDDR